jgi:DHA1 family multidrug resistance protein-like MFS transporter
VSSPATVTPTSQPRTGQDWRILVAVFAVTAMVESLGVSQIFALLPTYLRQMGVPDADRPAFIGIFSALIFVVGMPLVPLWGAWADKYSRKIVIVRSALVEAVVFLGVALAREPWQVALAMLLIGFQLGNTGIMLAGIRDVTPRIRLGTTIALFGAASAVGFAVGPALAGILIDGFGWELSPVFALSALLSVGTALLVTFGSREVRPEVVPTGRIVDLAFSSLRGVLTDAATRRIFLIFGISFVAIQMSRPYIPLLVEGINGLGPGLASAIALVMGTAALVGALVSPLGGFIGDRIGFRPVLITALSGAAVVLFLMPLVGSLGALALLAVGLGAATATVSSMIFGLLATELPAERRSAALNLVYLPLYAAGIIGPAAGAVVASISGVHGLFVVGAAVFLFGALTIMAQGRSATTRGAADATDRSTTPVQF